MKTQAMRILDGKKINYDVLIYPAREKDAEQIAQILKLAPKAVFKTLVVVRSSAKPLLVMIPADHKLDLKKVAKNVGEKKVKMASYQEAEELTGLKVGGISALALINRRFLPYLDKKAMELEKIYVSAGQRGYQIGLEPEDLIAITGAKVVDAVVG